MSGVRAIFDESGKKGGGGQSDQGQSGQPQPKPTACSAAPDECKMGFMT